MNEDFYYAEEKKLLPQDLSNLIQEKRSHKGFSCRFFFIKTLDNENYFYFKIVISPS